MKRSLAALPLFLFLCLAAEPGAPAENCAGAKVVWRSYDQALVAAHDKNLPVLLFFRRDGCRFCEMLVKNGFEREAVACYINRKFVTARIDVQEQPELKIKYRVAGEPTVWFLAPDGKGIDFFIGYVPPDRLLLILRYVGDGAYRTMTFEEFERREANSAKAKEGK
jgi:thioredoxin-related protein